jgi:iron complex outermembrane receptor protein
VHSEVGYVIDQDDTPVVAADVFLPSLAHDWTEELQIHNPVASRVKWVLGAFYFDAYGGFRPVNVNNGAVVLDDNQITHSASGFAQATTPIIEGTNLTLGARYTSENQQFVGTTLFGDTNAGTLSGSQTFTKTTWREAIDHHFNEDVMAYVSDNRGFKSGGYNALSFGSVNSFKPETLDAYEIGIKTEWLDHRLRWNSAAFLYNYTDIQIEVPVTGGDITSNGPKARIKGFENELQAKPLEQLELTAGLTYLDSHYTSYRGALAISPTGESGTIDATGKYTVASPKVTGNVGGNYTLVFAAGKLQPNISASYDDGYFFYADNRLAQPSYWLLNTSLTWYSLNDAWSIQAWGKNLNNAVYYQSRSEQGGLGDAQRQAPPRTFGLTFHSKF